MRVNKYIFKRKRLIDQPFMTTLKGGSINALIFHRRNRNPRRGRYRSKEIIYLIKETNVSKFLVVSSTKSLEYNWTILKSQVKASMKTNVKRVTDFILNKLSI